ALRVLVRAAEAFHPFHGEAVKWMGQPAFSGKFFMGKMESMTGRMTGLWTLAAVAALTGQMALGATVTGTVTDKTTNKPSAGDVVVLVDVQSGMAEIAKATTDGRGGYKLNLPG